MSRMPAPVAFAVSGAALAVVAASLLEGCAAHAPARLSAGSPDSCGLAVVVCVVDPTVRDYGELRQLTTSGIDFSDHIPVDAGVIVRLDAPDRLIRSTSVANVLVFRRLPPGLYRLRSLLQERRFLDKAELGRYDYYWERSIFAFDAGSARDLIFHVATGGLTYVGVVVVRADFHAVVNEDAHQVTLECSQDRVQYRLQPDEIREREVWGMLLRWYRGTAWEGPIEARIQALEARAR